MNSFFQDLRYGARQLWSNPGFTIAVILCIALGIGANTAVFSYTNALLFQIPEVEEPESLVRLYMGTAKVSRFEPFAYANYVDVRDKSDIFTSVVAEAVVPFNLSAGEHKERVSGSIVSGNYFSSLGVETALGRAFSPEEDKTPRAHTVAVIGYGLWQRAFAGDPQVIGKNLVANGHTFTVIGVARRDFHGTNVGFRSSLWVPLMTTPLVFPTDVDLFEVPEQFISFVMARLKPGVTLGQARESSRALMANLEQERPEIYTDKTITILPAAKAGLHPSVRGGVVGIVALTSTVVVFVLLLACANVAGLLLARFSTRFREIGIRQALGASRTRLVRQLLCESLLLSVLAGGLGLLLTVWLIPLIQMVLPEPDFPLQLGFQLRLDVPIDGKVLGFTFVASVLTGILFGLAPALQASKHDVVSSLKESTPGAGGRAQRLRRLVVVGQVALSLLLVIGATLLVRSLENLQQINLGYNPDSVLVAGLDLGVQGYDEAQAKRFRRDLKQRLDRLPNVERVGFATFIPLSVNARGRRAVFPEGHEVPAGSRPPAVGFNIVEHDYFRTMQIDLVRGRIFAETDDVEAPRVAVVNETFAEKFWPGENPIGKQLRTGRWDHEVIGLVKGTKYASLTEDPTPHVYLHMGQLYFRRAPTFVHLRAAGDPANLLSMVREEVRALDPILPIPYINTLHAVQGFALVPARLSAGVVTFFAVIAIVLAAVGIYGVIAYSVRRDARQIGIRMALGADSRAVLKRVVGEGMTLAMVGIAVGVVGGFAVYRLIGALLYEVSPTDTTSFVFGSAVLAGVAFLASVLPARRATRVNPIEVLHEE